jgi:hypothetical protein
MNLALFSWLVDESRVSQLYRHRRFTFGESFFFISREPREQQKSAEQQVKSRTERPETRYDDDDLLINQLSGEYVTPASSKIHLRCL